jgi:hypothetical protein
MPRLLKRAPLDSPWVTAAATALLAIAFVIALWNARGRDITRFIVLGSDSVVTAEAPAGIAVLPGAGYDGAAFYRLALDPFTGTRTAHGITLDNPAYRQQRIGYPLLVWLLSAGQAAAVPWLLVFVNVAALIALGGIGGYIARLGGAHAAWGLLVPLYPGFIYSLSRDLSEPLAAALGLGALLALLRRRDATAALLLTLAVLTRETALVIAGMAASWWLFLRLRRMPAPHRAVVFVLPAVVYAAWQAFLYTRWGVLPLSSGPGPLTFPFAEYVEAMRGSSSLRRGHRLVFTQLAYLGVMAISVLAALRASRAGAVPKLAWAAFLALTSILPRAVWIDEVGTMRILGDLHVAGATVLLLGHRTPRRVAMLTTVVVAYYVATHLVKYP